MSLLAGIGSVLGGIGGLFGGGSKQPKQLDPWHAMRKQVAGARDHAKEYGFNPLTLLQYGATSGMSGGGGSAPPLASVDLLVSGLKGMDDVLSGDAARRRAADQAELDLAHVALDQAKSGRMPDFAPATLPGASSVGNGASPLGRRSLPVPTMGGTTHAKPMTMGPDPWTAGREIERDPVVNMSGTFQLENPWTFGKPITLPGSEIEPEWDSVILQGAAAAPQIARNYVEKVKDDAEKARKDPEERKRQRSEAAESVLRHPPGFLGAFSRAYSIFN